MNTFLKRKRAIDRREQQLGWDKEKLLRESGWNYTSDFSDSMWRWCKEVKGGRITASRPDEALDFEEAWSQDPLRNAETH
jgi:hypothetical protein